MAGSRARSRIGARGRVPFAIRFSPRGRPRTSTNHRKVAWALAVATLFPVVAASPLSARAGAATAGGARSAISALLPATIASPHGGEFLSPSRNISCELDWDLKGLPAVAYCQTMAPPQSVTMSPTGRVKKCSGVSCLGNPALNARVLPYMTSVASGPFLCTSRLDGFACSASGHGFLISKSGISFCPVLPHTTMALYTGPARHPTLSVGSGFGWLVAVGRSGQYAEMVVQCGRGAEGKLPAGRPWTVDLSAVKAFEVETNPANPAAGSVLDVTRGSWVADVRVNGWGGYFKLGGKASFLSDGPGSSAC